MKTNRLLIALYTTAMGIESAWLWSLLLLVNIPAAGGRLSVLGLWLLFPVAFILNKGLLRWQRQRALVYIFNALAAAAGILLMVKAQLYGDLGLFDPGWIAGLGGALMRVFDNFGAPALVIIAGLILWIMGWRFARVNITFRLAMAEFQFGLI